MIELTPKERAALRARAHPLHPVVSIGQHGLTDAVLHEIDVALAAHELIKVRVHSDERDARAEMLASIASALSAAPVQHLGKLLVLWRPRPAEEAAKTPARAAKAAKPPKGGTRRAPAVSRERRTAAKPAPRSRGPAAQSPAAPRGAPIARRRRGIR